ncbi:MAG: hypothetical protein WAW13_00740 [Minisyncoccia bacterium]
MEENIRKGKRHPLKNIGFGVSVFFLFCFSFSITHAATLTLSGSLYSDEGTTLITAPKTIAIAVGTSTVSLYATTTAVSGTWSFTIPTGHSIGAATPILVWVDATTSVRAALITKASSTNNISGLNLYKDHVIVSHEGTSGTTTSNATMSFYDGDNDSDIQFVSNGDRLTVLGTQELYIKAGKTFAPGGSVSAFHTQNEGTLSASSTTLSLQGNYTNNGTFTHNSGTTEIGQDIVKYLAGRDAFGNSAGTGTGYIYSFTTIGTTLYVGKDGDATACSQTAGSAIGCELMVFDVSSTTNPVYVAGRDSSGNSTGTGLVSIYSLTTVGNMLYVGKESDATACSQTAGSAIGCELMVFNVSSTTNPIYVAGRDSSGNSTGTGSSVVNTLTSIGTTLYVGKNGDATACSQTAGSALGCELMVFDVSSTTNPIYVAGRDASGDSTGTGFTYIYSLTTVGTTLYAGKFADDTACSQTAGSAIGCELMVFDVSSTTNPIYVAGRDSSGNSTGTGLTYFLSLTTIGTTLYVGKEADATACSQTAGSAEGCELQVYDISSTTNPIYVAGRDASGDSIGTIYSSISSPTIIGNTLYVAKGDDGTACSQTAGSAEGCELQVYDISSTTNPIYVAGRDASGDSTGTGSASILSLTSIGTTLYVGKVADATACSQTAGSAIGCEIMVFTNYSSTTIAGSLTGSNAFNNVTAYGKVAFANNASTTNLTIQTGATVVAPTLLSVSGNYTNSGTFTAGSGTTTFSGDTDQTLSGNLNTNNVSTSSFRHLDFVGGGAKKPLAALGVTGNFTIATGTTFIASSTMEVVGNYRNNGTLKTADPTWVSRTSAADNAWLSVTYGNGLFVAVAETGTGNRVMTSPDGITWTSRTSAADNAWYSVTYGNGLFVVVSYDGTGNRVMTSPDGITWTSRTSAADNQWYSVTYGNGLFVAVACGTSYCGDAATTSLVMTSSDGINWTLRTIPDANSYWNSVTYGNGLFVAVSCGATFFECQGGSGANQVMTSPNGITWTVRTAASDNAWQSITYGNGLFVAVAETGTGNRVMTSPDGITWTSRTSAADNVWNSVTYGNGLFVAVAWDGTGNRVMTSPDGITWTSRTSAANNSWYSVTYGNGLFVAVSCGTGCGDPGGINSVMTSPESHTLSLTGTTTQTLSGTMTGTSTLPSLIFKNGGVKTFTSNASTSDFIIATTSGTVTAPSTLSINGQLTNGSTLIGGTNLFLSGNYSNTGTTTAPSDFTFNGIAQTATGTMTGTNAFNNITLSGTGQKAFITNASTTNITVGAGTEFVAPEKLSVAGDYVNNGTSTYRGGIHWTSRTSAADNSWQSVTYGNGLFVAVSCGTGCGDPGGINSVMTSPDGITWTSRTSAVDNYWMSVTYGNGLFVAVAQLGTGNRVMTSPDGITWTSRTSAVDNYWMSVTYGNGLFVAVSADGTGNRVMTSPDGITWTSRTSAADNQWRAITYGNGLFVAVTCGTACGDPGGINSVMTSPDGITWTSRTSATDNQWLSVTYGNDLFVAVSSDGISNRVMTSPDGITWTSRTSAADNSWYFVTYGNGLFVAVSVDGTGNRVMTSPDGITWTSRTAAADNSWTSVTYGNGLFVAVSADGTGNRVMTSAPASLTFSSTTAQSIGGTLSGASAFGNITFSGSGTKTFSNNASTSDFTIGTGATVVAPASLSLIGNYTNSGTFTAGSGTTTFTGTDAQTATGTLSFNNIEILNTTATTTFGATLTVAGTLKAIQPNTKIAFSPNGTNTIAYATITGTSGNEIRLRSTTEGTPFKFVVSSAYTINYVNVKDSNACSSVGGGITATSSINATGNTCWTFLVGSPTSLILTGSLYSDEGNTLIGTVKTIKIAVSTSTVSVHSTTTSSGAYTLTIPSGHTIGTSTPILIYVDGDSNTRAALITKASSTQNIANLNLYQNYVIIKNEGESSTSTRATDLTQYDSANDSDIQFTASSTLDTFVVPSSQTLYVAASSTFLMNMPTVTGNFKTATTGTIIASSTLSVSGNYTNLGTFTHSSGTITFSSTSAQSLSGTMTGTSAFNHVSMLGSGTKTFANNASTTNLTINTGATVVAPAQLTIRGSLRNNGTFDTSTNSNTLTMDAITAEVAQYLAGRDASGNSTGTGWMGIRSVVTSGMYLYVGKYAGSPACSQTAGSAIGCELMVFDISSPTNPVYVAGRDVSGNSTGTGAVNINSLTIVGTTLYVVKGGDATACSQTAGSAIGCELMVFDISSPTNPVYVAGRDVSGNSTGTGTLYDGINSLTAIGTTLYAGKYGDATACSQTAGSAIGCELMVFDVSSTTNPVYVAGRDASGNSTGTGSVYVTSLTAIGTTLYAGKYGDPTACSQTAGSADGCELMVFDVSSTTNPVYVAGRDVSGNSTGTGGSTFISLTAIGTTLYAGKYGDATACSQTAGSADGCELMVFDVSSTTNPVYVAGRDSSGNSTGISNGNIHSLTAIGTTLYVGKSSDPTACSQTAGSADGCELMVFDVSSTTNPVYVAGRDASGNSTGTSSIAIISLTTSGNSLYVGKVGGDTACSQTAGSAVGCELMSFSVSDPTGILIGTLVGSSALRSVALSGNTSFRSSASTTNLTILSTATTSAGYPLSISGNYTDSGVFTTTADTFFTGASSQILSGTMTGTSTFKNVHMQGSGTKTFSNNASTSDFTISSGSTVIAPNALTIRGVYTNNGTFTHNSGTLYLEGGSVASGTMTGTSALGDVVVNTYRVSNVDSINTSILSALLSALVIDDVTGILYVGTADWAGSLLHCVLTTGCDEESDFTGFIFPYLDPFDLGAINDLVIDTVNRVLYAGISDSASGGLVLRCVLSTGCSAPIDFTIAYDTTESHISSLTIDTTNGVLYAGSGSGGIIYRCLISTGCDAAGDFTTAYDTTESQISSLTIDTTNGVLYAGSYTGGIIYRCLISTGCDAAGDFTTAYDTTGLEINSMSIDQTHGVLYAGTDSSPGGNIYRCITSTGCDASGDFAAAFTSSSESIDSIAFNATNDILYAVSDSYGGNMYRCVTSTGCDSQNEFMSVENVANGNVYFEEVIVDPTSNRVFVGGYYQFYTFSNSATFMTSASTTNLTIDPGYSLVAPGNLSIAGAYTNSGIFTHNSGTTTFNGSSAQTATGTMTGTSAFNNLSFTGAGTKTFSNNASTTNLTIQTGATVVAPSILSLSGNYTNNGTFTHASGTVLMSSTSAQSLTGTLLGTSAFNNLSFTGAGTKTFSNNASTSNFTVDAGATVVAPSILSLSGNYTNNGTFTHNSGTVILSGSATQTATGTMTGTSAFNNLTLTNTSANGSTSQSVIFGKQASTTGTFKMLPSTSALMNSATSTFTNINLGGVVNQYVWLRSTASGTPWGLNVTGTQEQVSYVNVKDSSACDGSTISASDGTNIDAGGNTCWSFINTTPNLSSGAHQIFSLAQATTTISPITLADAATPAITAANDIRIKIATSTITMLWDTTDTTATITGTASGKVSTTVSYEGAGSVLVVAVSSDFASNETITISDLSFTTFGALRTATSVLSVYTGGVADATSDDADDKTIAISGSLTMANHTLGQVSNAFTASTLTTVPLFAFKLTPAGEDVNVTSLVFPIRGIEGIIQAELTNAALYRDTNSNGVVDGGDVAVGGAGAVALSGQTGTVTFGTTIVSTTSRDYILVGDVSNVKVLDSITTSLAASDMTSVGVTTGLSVGETGSISGLQHMKGGGGAGSNGGAVGGDAPAGQGVTTGGGGGGGEGIDPNSGDTIGNEPGFNAPSSNGTPQGAWTGGANAYSSDGVYVTTAGSGAQHSYGAFGFYYVPTNNTITGIEVKLEASGSTAAGTISVRLSWDGGSSVTSLQTTGTLNTTDGVYTLGGPSDMWGHSWIPSEMNNENFAIELVANPSSNTVQLDAIQVRVYHQATGGGGGGGGAVWKQSDQYFANVSSAVHGVGNFWTDIFNYLLDLFTQESIL